MARKHDSLARRDASRVAGDSADSSPATDWTQARFQVRNGGKAWDSDSASSTLAGTSADWQHPSGGIVSRSARVPPPRASEGHYSPGLRSGAQLQSRARPSADAVAIGIILTLVVLLAWVLYQNRSRPQSVVSPGNPTRVVWADRGTGLYFCPGAKLYGKGQGKFMTQREAMLQAYQPALRSPCN